MQNDSETLHFAAIGRSTLLPGMQYMVEQMQALVDDFRERLATLETPPAPAASPEFSVAERKADIRRRRTIADITTLDAPAVPDRANRGWSADPAERKAEMRRRRSKAAKRRAREAA